MPSVVISDELRDQLRAAEAMTVELVDSAGERIALAKPFRTELTDAELEARYADPVRHTPEQVMARLRELAK